MPRYPSGLKVEVGPVRVASETQTLGIYLDSVSINSCSWELSSTSMNLVNPTTLSDLMKPVRIITRISRKQLNPFSTLLDINVQSSDMACSISTTQYLLLLNIITQLIALLKESRFV